MSELIIRGPIVHGECESLPGVEVHITEGKIQAISPQSRPGKDSGRVLEFPSNYHLIPGMIDLHIHGADHADVMDASPEALATIAQALVKEGTTSFLATTMTDTSQKLIEVMSAVQQYISSPNKAGAEIVGIHLEGPFISPSKIGAQRGDALHIPDINLFEQWQAASGKHIKLVTLAPELPQAKAFIEHLVKNGVIASLGHSNANLTEAKQGIEAGIRYATHLYNAMSGLQHNDPGAALAILLDERVLAELIVDGVHVHPEMIKFTLKAKGSQHLVLVTDAMRAKCCGEGEFELGGQPVVVKNGEARLKHNGKLAGSVLKMNQALKNMLQFSHCSMQDVIKMVSANPAKALKIFDRKGSIAVGKLADLAVLNEHYQVVATLRQGHVVYGEGNV
ncbi:MAG: N-acetylglucosamine-6-phosphate deacetylase [Gammaproteobacteria bacterium]|jgi:N-acetylglucosamine-6-phosphate deacetylase|nr:N-acetylglucosamine-6-phosphate deacetylase [Gammaproteobacteria bacterium]